MARYPAAEWRPLGKQTQPRMTKHDLVILHTMGGGSLQSTDRQFHDAGYGGLESHFGVGADGTVYQWQDTAYTADANLDANPRAISIETADAGVAFKDWTGSNVPSWNTAQTDALIKLVRWCCDTHDIPKAMVPDSKPSRRGIAGHRQGINSSPAGQPGYRVPGGELWSSALGKVCPGDRRFAQIQTVIVPGVRTPIPPPPPPPQEEDDMPALAQFVAPHPKAPATYITDFKTRRGVINGTVLAQLEVGGVTKTMKFSTDADMDSGAGPLDPDSPEYNPVTKKWEAQGGTS